MKKDQKELIKLAFIVGSAIIVLCIIFFSPFIVCLITGNWWFMLLFLVSWIPTIGTVMVISALLNLFDI